MTISKEIQAAIEDYGQASCEWGAWQAISRKKVDTWPNVSKALRRLWDLLDGSAPHASLQADSSLETIVREADKRGLMVHFGYAGTYGYEFGPNGEPWGAMVGTDERHYGWTIAQAASKALAAASTAADGGSQ